MNHIVAIIGSGVSGAEAAFRLTAKGIRCVVFDQNLLPYGKLESGLPKWHIKLRNMHENKIDGKLDHPLVKFVPGVRLGENFDLDALLHTWKFSAVLLATGAWKDRPLPVSGIDKFQGKGFFYQNPFVANYNQSHEPGLNEEVSAIKENAVIIGGGLASLDVVKIVMIETVKQALETKGLSVDVFSLEEEGINQFLQSQKLKFTDLNINPCTLVYRRSADEMPLSPAPPKVSEESIEKTRLVRRKILNNLMEKFPFKLLDNTIPVSVLTENDRLSGLVLRKTQSLDDGVAEIKGSNFELHSSLVISAIGSIPESIPGIPMKYNTFDIVDAHTGELKGYNNVFAIGNAVTGRGNIRESQLHGKKVAEYVHDYYLVTEDSDYKALLAKSDEDVKNKIEGIEKKIINSTEPEARDIELIDNRIKQYWQTTGYEGEYKSWVSKYKPIRMEDL